MPGVDAELGERALVDQQVDPLARGQLVRVVLLGDLLLAAAELAPARGARARSSTSGRRRRGRLLSRWLIASPDRQQRLERCVGHARVGAVLRRSSAVTSTPTISESSATAVEQVVELVGLEAAGRRELRRA